MTATERAAVWQAIVPEGAIELGDVAELLTFQVDFEHHIGRFVQAKDRRLASAPYPGDVR